jgi:hypothetical protein
LAPDDFRRLDAFEDSIRYCQSLGERLAERLCAIETDFGGRDALWWS